MSLAFPARLILAAALIALPACASLSTQTGGDNLAWNHETPHERIAARLTGTLAGPGLPAAQIVGGMRVVHIYGSPSPGGVFKKTPSGYRHGQSGLICRESAALPALDSDLSTSLDLDFAIRFEETGEDVGCVYGRDDRLPALTLFATYLPGRALEKSLDATDTAIRRRLPQAVSESLTVALDDTPRPVRARSWRIGAIDGRPVKSSVWITSVRGWHLKLRLTYFAEDALLQEFGAPSLLIDTARTMEGRLPAGAGP